ncbi:MAG: hypothetical protein ACT4PL_07660 [Phycisphaerales bacterium]
MMTAPKDTSPANAPRVDTGLLSMLSALAVQAQASGMFGALTKAESRLTCPSPAADAQYRVDVQAGLLCVSLVTADRYLSQSIEQDLVHTGDKLADLLHDELVDVDYDGPALTVDHYRSEDKLFTFRTRLPFPPDQWAQAGTHERVWKVLQAYEACFRPLGGMAGEDDD